MKDFHTIAFDPQKCSQELDEFRKLLDSKDILSEQDDLQPFFERSLHLTSYVGTTFGLNIGIARQVAYQFELLGDYSADVVIGNRERQFCWVELENGDPKAVLAKVADRATKEWGRRLEHGFSQLVDWFYLLDDFKNNDRLQRNFGYGHIDFVGLLLIGHTRGLDDHDIRRLRWCTRKVIIDSHPIICMTFDQLYHDLKDRLDLYSAAFKLETQGGS